MTTLDIGDTVPTFAAETNHGKLNSKDLLGKPFVLYFYPRDNTPGCTNEAKDFQANLNQFEKLNFKIIGVSRDSLASHEKFAAKYALTFPLIADTEASLCNLFDVIKDKKMYGRQVRGIERSTFLFNASGKLVKQWRKVRVPGHVDAVLDAAKELT